MDSDRVRGIATFVQSTDNVLFNHFSRLNSLIAGVKGAYYAVILTHLGDNLIWKKYEESVIPLLQSI